MLTNQQIFNHCVTYFNNRLNKGSFVGGWGDFDDPNNRCAIGSLDIKRHSSYLEYRKEINKLCGDIQLTNNTYSNEFCTQIIHFNDSLARSTILNSSFEKDENCFLRYKDKYRVSIISFLTDLSVKYGLDYNSNINLSKATTFTSSTMEYA